jgi:hypothetical protein
MIDARSNSAPSQAMPAVSMVPMAQVNSEAQSRGGYSTMALLQPSLQRSQAAGAGLTASIQAKAIVL